MVKKLFFFLCIALFFGKANALYGPQESIKSKKDIKVLVLIIASDDFPVYVQLQKIWRAYMHLDPAHIEAYFIKGNPNLSTVYKIDKDIIWSRTSETLKPGIINKTLISMEALLPRIDEFDYVLRTNLSSFYIFPRLLEFLKTCPKKELYAGSIITKSLPIGSGCGIIMSSDVAKTLVQNKSVFWNNTLSNDDVLIGRFLIHHGIQFYPHKRMDVMPIKVWHDNKNFLPLDIFHFRIKNAKHLRMSDDIFVHHALAKMNIISN